jgi:hypothetical protein
MLLLSIQPAFASSDDYIKGYADAIIEEKLHIETYSLEVREGMIELRLNHAATDVHDETIKALSVIEGVSDVVVTDRWEDSNDNQKEDLHGPEGKKIGIPVSQLRQGRLFEALIADPRWPHFSISYQRYIDDRELRNVGATSFGETLPFYTSEAPFGGEYRIGIQAAVFAVFDLDTESIDLINADYWVGIPLTYRKGAFSSLIRLYHQSSHLGDEFLLRSRIDRINLSYEAFNLTTSYEPLTWLRLYSGASYIFHKQPPDLDPWSIQYGLEVKSPSPYLRGNFTPVFGADFKNSEEQNWSTDISLRAGFQIESEKTVWNRLYFMLEYFHGHSPNGQFYDRSTEYLSLATHFYFQ